MLKQTYTACCSDEASILLFIHDSHYEHGKEQVHLVDDNLDVLV